MLMNPILDFPGCKIGRCGHIQISSRRVSKIDKVKEVDSSSERIVVSHPERKKKKISMQRLTGLIDSFTHFFSFTHAVAP